LAADRQLTSRLTTKEAVPCGFAAGAFCCEHTGKMLSGTPNSKELPIKEAVTNAIIVIEKRGRDVNARHR
jgi:hypothetical protein